MTPTHLQLIYTLCYNAAAIGTVDGIRAGFAAVSGTAAPPLPAPTPPPSGLFSVEQLRERLAGPPALPAPAANPAPVEADAAEKETTNGRTATRRR